MSVPNSPSHLRGIHAALVMALLSTTTAIAGDRPGIHFAPAEKSSRRAAKQTPDLSKGNTMFVVPYAHLDTQWRWAYPQVVREFIANTLRHNFDLIDKYPHYVFNFSGSRRYEMMREYYPAEYQRLKGYIKAGRWFPCGSSVDEGDANVPSAESLVRHVLYGNRYFRKEFGVASREFMLPDCFGFPYALPSILAHCGVEGFSTQKLTWGSAVGIPFKVGTWEGPDGKSVVAALDPGSYGGDVEEDLSQNTSWLARIQNTGKISGAYVDYHYYGTGDRGGAPNASSVNWVEKSVNGSGPIKVISSQADAMVAALTKDQIAKLPHYKGELLLTQHSAGSITSQAYMKRWNRKSELLADAAERASVAAKWFAGTPYPAERLYTGWDLVLGSQMHDMLPGTSIPKAYEFCWNDFLLAQNTFAAVEKDAVGALSAHLDTRGRGHALVVYNPLSIAREDVAEATLPSAAGYQYQVASPTGATVPVQTIKDNGSFSKIIFLAKVPSTSFAVYDARLVPNPRTTRFTTDWPHIIKGGIENQRFTVTLNADGDIASIYDKQIGKEMLKAPSRLEMQYHNPSAFPAWNMDWDDAKLPPRDIVHGPAKIHILEQGPVRASIDIERTFGASKFVQTIRLSSGGAGDRVEVATKIDWRTRERALKVSFPLTSGNPEATYDLQLGAIRRGNNSPRKYEVPQHQWLDLTSPDRSYGVGILNDGKYGSDKPDDDTVRLTLLYTPGVRSGFQDQATQDFGRHDTLYAIAPHAGDWQSGGVEWTAKRLNQPLRAFEVRQHNGWLGKSFSLVDVNSHQVEISALKKAEDSNEVIVRLRELEGRPASGIHLHMSGGIASAREISGQELPLGPATVRNGELITNVSPYSLRAFALKLADAPVAKVTTVSKSVPLSFDQDVVSTVANPKDGSFDKAGRSYSAEQFPRTMSVDSIQFRLGSTKDGEKNALTCHGQTIALPKGFGSVYILAASDGDRRSDFQLGGVHTPTTVQDWNQFIGSWDNRQWDTDPGPNFSDYHEMAGLVPGYVKPSEVAWYASHRHDPNSGNTFYDYSYLFKYGFEIPSGVSTLTLPNDPHIRVFAVSVAKGGHDSLSPSAPLSDTLTDHQGLDSPTISPSPGTYHDATKVTLTPPFYYEKGGLRYSTDGQNPTLKSTEYRGPFLVSDPTTIMVAEINSAGQTVGLRSAKLNVVDTTPPSIVYAMSAKALGIAQVQFSEPVDATSAEDVNHYRISSGIAVVSAKLAPDGTTVDLTFVHELASGTDETVTVNDIKDRALHPNLLGSQTVTMAERGSVFNSATVVPNKGPRFPVSGLPVKAGSHWTLNLFCRLDAQPEDRTIIAGFGRDSDGQEGTGRYFTKFADGINFWICNRDVQTQVPLDLGKWQMLTATYDGESIRLYKNAQMIAEQKVELADDISRVSIAPLDAWDRVRRFNGLIQNLTVWDQDLSAAAIQRLRPRVDSGPN